MMKFIDYENWEVNVDARRIVRIALNVPDRPLNVLNESVMDELQHIVSEVEDSDAALLVIESSKESGFLAGADVSVIANIESPEQALHLIEKGQLLFQRIEWLTIPTIAVIHGPCLGGGLELSLACNYRIARDNSSTAIGLPEIKLGLIPGWGGTQRLPKLVGLTESLSMILQGKTKDARSALAIGLIDKAVAPEHWSNEVDAFIDTVVTGGSVTAPSSRRSLRRRLVEGTSLGRSLILKATKKRIAKSVNHYPALGAAIKAISHSFKRGVNGFECERQEFAKLLPTPTCRSLLKLFFSRESARTLSTWSSGGIRAALGEPIQTVGVVGAGTMGAGIAQLSALRGFDVIVQEIDDSAVAAGQQRIDSLLNKVAARKNWTTDQHDKIRERVLVTTDQMEMSKADLVVEAIVERMDVKKMLFDDLEHRVDDSAILATNTSSLSVDEMSGDLSRRGRFGGLHFFNPVHRMELVEVVRGKSTSDETVARLVSFVRALGKTPIVTSDSPGFLVNRVLFPYLGEAVLMVREGHDIAAIDKNLRKFGMPMGPLELLDQVGIDVALHVANSLRSVLGDTEPVAEFLSKMVEQGRLGKKANRGFYDYNKERKSRAMEIPSVASKRRLPSDFINDGLNTTQRRLIYPMLAESVRCLDERVVQHAWMVDLAMVLGTGFAPHTGGPLHVLDTIGTKNFLVNCRLLQSVCGERFAPPRSLRQMSNSGATFFQAADALGGAVEPTES